MVYDSNYYDHNQRSERKLILFINYFLEIIRWDWYIFGRLDHGWRTAL